LLDDATFGEVYDGVGATILEVQGE
jgi:hypothetical protein